MVTVTATEFAKNFGRYRETVQREPIAVTAHERVTGYFVSKDDYESLQALKERLPRAYAVKELPSETLQAIAEARMDARHDTLNSLLDD